MTKLEPLVLTMLPALLVIGGCGSLEEQQTLDSYYHHDAARVTDSVSPGALHDFIVDVARNRATLVNTVDGRAVRGIFITNSGRCRRVAVMNTDVPGRRAVRASTYEVCAGRVRNVTSAEPAPSYPDQADAQFALASARQAALLYGPQNVRFQAYEIAARALGVAGARPCMPVETTISYHADLVSHEVSEECSHPTPVRK
jgi:regulator of extracellular matrix RemA (YlzA/DUF370 family)